MNKIGDVFDKFTSYCEEQKSVNAGLGLYISKQIIMKRVTETFIQILFIKKWGEATHDDNHIVDNTSIIMDQ